MIREKERERASAKCRLFGNEFPSPAVCLLVSARRTKEFGRERSITTTTNWDRTYVRGEKVQVGKGKLASFKKNFFSILSLFIRKT